LKKKYQWNHFLSRWKRPSPWVRRRQERM